MTEVAIEVQGLEVRGFHGVLPQERQRGQPFVFDILLIAHDAGIRSDELADTVDYTAVVTCVRKLCEERRFNLIEALAAAVADELVDKFPVSRVRVRVRKPEVQLDVPVEYTAATIERARR
jgi:7,8-dihydroneopterin aldolase/epimerase/oxygenase